MRLPALLVLSAIALGAAACATAPVGSPAPVETASSSPAPLENHDWFLNGSDDEPTLLYGFEDSDDIWIVLSCERPGKLTLLQPAVEPHPILIESGGETETYPAEPRPSELHDILLSASAEASDPVFQRFRRVNWLAVHGEAGRVVMAAHPGSESRIADFFRACG